MNGQVRIFLWNPLRHDVICKDEGCWKIYLVDRQKPAKPDHSPLKLTSSQGNVGTQTHTLQHGRNITQGKDTQ